MRDTPVSPSPFRDALAGGIQRARSSNGLTQAELAKAVSFLGIDWSQTTVAKAEAGSRVVTAEELIILCIALGVGVADLTGDCHIGGTEMSAGVVDDAVTGEVLDDDDEYDCRLIQELHRWESVQRVRRVPVTPAARRLQRERIRAQIIREIERVAEESANKLPEEGLA